MSTLSKYARKFGKWLEKQNPEELLEEAAQILYKHRIKLEPRIAIICHKQFGMSIDDSNKATKQFMDIISSLVNRT